MSLSKKLKKLLFERELTPTDLANALDMSIPTVHRIVTGRTQKPHEKSIQAISDFFEVDVKDLVDNDLENTELTATNTLKHVPVLEWSTLDVQMSTLKSDVQVIVSNVSNKSFALIMPNHSMEPLVEKGSTLIFDPEVETPDRSYVLVKLSEPNIYVLRQLLIDLENSFIKSLNNDIGAKSLRLLSKEDIIIAKLVEIRRKL